MDSFSPQDIFDLQLVESVDVNPVDMENTLCLLSTYKCNVEKWHFEDLLIFLSKQKAA